MSRKKNAAGAELRADVRESVHDMKIGSTYKTSYSSASLIATVRAATSLSVFSMRYVRARSAKSGAACLVFAAFTSGPWSSAQPPILRCDSLMREAVSLVARRTTTSPRRSLLPAEHGGLGPRFVVTRGT